MISLYQEWQENPGPYKRIGTQLYKPHIQPIKATIEKF